MLKRQDIGAFENATQTSGGGHPEENTFVVRSRYVLEEEANHQHYIYALYRNHKSASKVHLAAEWLYLRQAIWDTVPVDLLPLHWGKLFCHVLNV